MHVFVCDLETPDIDVFCARVGMLHHKKKLFMNTKIARGKAAIKYAGRSNRLMITELVTCRVTYVEQRKES